MATQPRTFPISFVALLADVCEKLKLNEPQYTQPNPSLNLANLKLKEGSGPVTLEFIGTLTDTLNESWESAAQQAIGYLVQKGKVIIDDVNLVKHTSTIACHDFYKAKREETECVEQGRLRVTGVAGKNRRSRLLVHRPKVVSINYWLLLHQIISYYGIQTTSTESLIQGRGNHVCSLGVKTTQSPDKMVFFVSDCSDSIAMAHQGLEKKVIAHLQPIYGFLVNDANYARLSYEELQCKLQFESSAAAKERVWGTLDFLQPYFLPAQNPYQTPTSSNHQIPAPHAPPAPPPPKKPKSIWSAAASSSRAPNLTISIPEHDWNAFKAPI